MSSICPGVDFLLNQNYTHSDFLQVNVSDCQNYIPQSPAQQGVVYGVCHHSTSFCRMHLKGSYVFLRVYMNRLEYECDTRHWRIKIKCYKTEYGCGDYSIECGSSSLEHTIYECEESVWIESVNSPMISINIDTTDTSGITVKHLTENTGYIAVPIACRGCTSYTSQLHELKVASKSKSTVAISIQNTLIDCLSTVDVTYQLNFLCRRGKEVILCVFMKLAFQTATHIFYHSRIMIQFESVPYLCPHRPYFIMTQFAVSPGDARLEKLPSGLFNCSSVHYPKHQDILQCNLKTECEGGQDETEHCPFSSPGCQGMVASHNKCYQLIEVENKFATAPPRPHCDIRNKTLATVKTLKEKKDAVYIFKRYEYFDTAFGLLGGHRFLPFMYRFNAYWVDKTVAYTIDHFSYVRKGDPSPRSSFVFYLLSFLKLDKMSYYTSILCEFKSQDGSISPPAVSICDSLSSSFMFSNTQQMVSVGTDKHVMHQFMLGDCSSDSCLQRTRDTLLMDTGLRDKHNVTVFNHRELASGMVMFECDDDEKTVHYTVVCDFNKDCLDLSDESFCEHPQCPGFLCENGQCVLDSQQCNGYSDCLDNSDERLSHICINRKQENLTFNPQNKGLYINLDGTGYFTRQLIGDDEPCPDSHYRCTAEWLYCLPVYTRCNGMSDCVYGEDEQVCERATCPGFYQCQDSRVCVHGDHLCDGWGQCPQRDDELMCDMATCPQGCLCEGHWFVCNSKFLPDLFPQLRYSDVTGTGMTLTDFRMHIYLVVLILSNCSLFNISSIIHTNLQYIDISTNYIKTLNIAHVLQLPHLKILILTNNPLSHSTNTLRKHVNYPIRRVSLSQTHPNIVNIMLSVYFYQLEYVNLSRSGIETFGSLGFVNAPHLCEVDLQWNPISTFPWDSLLESLHLKNIFSSDYRFCCQSLFHQHLIKLQCHSSFTILQACERLLPSELHRLFFLLISIFAIVGNVACFCASFTLIKLFGKEFWKAIGHLQFANTCMGVHVGITIVGDGILHGKYVITERDWVNSVLCKVGGFLWFVSHKMAVLVIVLINLNHFSILRFSSKTKQVSDHITDLTFSVAWCVGIVLSVIPFLPGLSHWGVHGQSGLCRLAIFTRYGDLKTLKWFSVVCIVNFVVCLPLVFFICVIQKQLPAYRIQLNPTKRSLYFSAHLTTKIAVTITACWLTLGLVVMLSTAGVAALHRIQEAMVVFVLPLHSALCPVIYVWAVLTEQRGRTQEEKMLKLLKSRDKF